VRMKALAYLTPVRHAHPNLAGPPILNFLADVVSASATRSALPGVRPWQQLCRESDLGRRPLTATANRT
jgi:hypothetical protein